ncbi:MAG: hypothetical protein ACKOA8_04105 [Deltaproteobacteria bacterium]
MISDSSIKWIENLAEQEGLILSGVLPNLDISRTRDEVLAVSTSVFMRELKAQWLMLSKLFNSRMKEPAFCITWGEISERPDNFFLERNSVRLVVTSVRSGSIQIKCEKLSLESPSKTSTVFSGVLEGRFSNFDEVTWHFLEKPITAEQFSRYYLTEFLQSSRALEKLF